MRTPRDINQPISHLILNVCFLIWNRKCLAHSSSSFRQLTLGRLFAKFLVVVICSSAFCFIISCQLNNILYYLQFRVQRYWLVTPTVSIDRATCCFQQSINQPEDICGRSNCTLPCTEPKNPIPQLVNDDPTRSQHSSQDNKGNAFFIETTGNGALNYRQACAVESLALHNPNLTVHVLFADATINSSLDTLETLVKNYANVQFVSLDVGEYMAGTLMDHWYHCTDWRNGSYHVNNLSNALRLLTVYKYGGYYFDLDIISLRPVTYYRNFVAAESDKHVNNGVIHADLKNSLIETTIKDFVVNFRPDVWGNNGPALIFRVLQKWCNADNLKTMEYINCRGFNILPESSFHPVHFDKMKELFAHPLTTNNNETDNETKSISWLTEKVIGVHTWNKLSKDEPIYRNATHAYNRLARDHCPHIFSISPEIF